MEPVEYIIASVIVGMLLLVPLVVYLTKKYGNNEYED